MTASGVFSGQQRARDGFIATVVEADGSLTVTHRASESFVGELQAFAVELRERGARVRTISTPTSVYVDLTHRRSLETPNSHDKVGQLPAGTPRTYAMWALAQAGCLDVWEHA